MRLGTIRVAALRSGVGTSVLLYIPLSITALSHAAHASTHPVTVVLQAIAAGVALQLVPILTLVITAAESTLNGARVAAADTLDCCV